MDNTPPFNSQKLSALNALVSQCTITELAWLSGYLWARASTTGGETSTVPATAARAVSTTAAAPRITLISASQTGNARRVVEDLLHDLQRLTVEVTHIHAGNYTFRRIAEESLLILVTSTQGEGEAPDEALPLFRFLSSKKAPRLEQLQFAVFGLGDSSYVNFCQAGKDFEARLLQLGAQPLLNRVDADTDYQDQATQWRQALVDRIAEKLKNRPAVHTRAAETAQTMPDIVVESARYGKESPLAVMVNVNQKITARNAEKDIRHMELDLSDSQIRYQPGDTLGVWYTNSEALVSEVLDYLQLKTDAPVDVNGRTLPLHTALAEHFELHRNTPQTVQQYARLSGDASLRALIDDSGALRNFSNRTPVVDMLRRFPCRLSPQDCAGLLRPITPRMYSISSAQDEVGDEVHLTVGVVRYEMDDILRFGGASGYLASRTADEDQVRIFIEPNDNFRLPADNTAPVILIGAGTGIAPFRAFMQQRACHNASGKNWLIFGNTRFTTDFLYQLEWQRYVKDGLLHQVDLAWSRDQAEKVYIQHRIMQQAALFWQWLQEGACVYVCGDAARMAKDVDQAILGVIQQQGRLDAEQAGNYMNELRISKRYQRDIY